MNRGWCAPIVVAAVLTGCGAGAVHVEDSKADPAPGDTDTGAPVDTAESGDTTGSGDTAESGESGDTAIAWPAPCSAYLAPVVTGTVADEDLNEISGIGVSRQNPGVLWVHEDHLAAAEVYALDTAGNTLLTVELEDATNNDWEDLAVAPCTAEPGSADCIWVGEIGNNEFDREGLGVYRITEPVLADLVDTKIKVSWDFFGVVYPDMAENAEALAIGADGLPILFSKRYELGTSGVYRLPTLDPTGEVTLEHLSEITSATEADSGAAAAVTAADLWPDGSRVILRTYSDEFELDVGDWADLGTSPRLDLTPPDEPHGEAIAYDPVNLGFWTIAEGINPSIWYTGCAE